MLPREEKYIIDWEKKMGRGKWQYIILTAIVWGLIIPFIVKLFVLAAQAKIFDREAWAVVFLTKNYLIFCSYFFLALLAYGIMMWQLASQKYRQLKQRQEEERKNSFPYHPHSH